MVNTRLKTVVEKMADQLVDDYVTDEDLDRAQDVILTLELRGSNGGTIARCRKTYRAKEALPEAISRVLKARL